MKLDIKDGPSNWKIAVLLLKGINFKPNAMEAEVAAVAVFTQRKLSRAK